MGALAAQSSLAASFCCQFDRRNPHDSASTLAPSRVSFAASRKPGFIRRSQDGTTEQGTDKVSTSTKVEPEQERGTASTPKLANSSPSPSSSPFAAGKISSRLAAGKSLDRATSKATSSSSSSLPPSVLDSSDQAPSSKAFPNPAASPFSTKTPSGSVSGSGSNTVPFPSSSPLKPSSGASSRASKAFPAPPPSVSSPFESKSPSSSPSPRRRRDVADIDERILASRKEILDTLWKERRQQPRMNAAPADIFDDPKPSELDKEYKFDLIRGTKPIVLVISFSIIVAIMFGTAFVAWKLGAFHYDEY